MKVEELINEEDKKVNEENIAFKVKYFINTYNLKWIDDN